MYVYKLNFTQPGQKNSLINNATLTASFKPYGETVDSPLALGIRKVEFSRNGQHVLVGYFDSKMRLYNALTWREIFAFDHSLEELNETNTPEVVNIYTEAETKDQHGTGTFYEAMARPYELPQLTNVQ